MLRLYIPRGYSQIRNYIYRAVGMAMGDVAHWMRFDLINAMVGGGLGIEGIEQTAFYRWISSSEGLSELGIEPDQPPRLLRAYATTAFQIKSNRRSVYLGFGDVTALKVATPHPASGTGKLNIDSWLTWIVDKKKVTDAGFIPKAKLPKSLRGRSRLRGPLGGVMWPRGALGSTGEWKAPENLAEFDQQWLASNKSRIERAIIHQTEVFIQRRLNRG